MIKFWTLQYFMDNESNFIVYFRIGITALVVLIFLFFLLRTWKNRNTSKYRDLLVIFLLLSVILLVVQYNNFQAAKNSFNNSAQVTSFINSVSKSQHVNKNDIAVSSQNLTSGMIVKIKKNYYRVTFNADQNMNAYELTKTNLINNDVSLVRK